MDKYERTKRVRGRAVEVGRKGLERGELEERVFARGSDQVAERGADVSAGNPPGAIPLPWRVPCSQAAGRRHRVYRPCTRARGVWRRLERRRRVGAQPHSPSPPSRPGESARALGEA
eukprot:scaffold224112_cov30-Tisochrysis_lutea.AAC.1